MSELKVLQDELLSIDVMADKQKNKLMRDYALERARYSVGDYVTGRCETILVSLLKWTSGRLGNDPEVVYYGKVLTKKMIPRKDGETGVVYACDVIKLENKE